MVKKFTYKAKNSEGDKIAGTIDAASERAAAADIQKRGYFVTSLKETREQNHFLRYFRGWRGVCRKDIAILCRKLAIMINVGIPLMTALRVLIAQTKHVLLKESLSVVYAEVEQGRSLTDALRMCPEIFPPLMVHMISAGEESGMIGAILERLSTHFEKEHKVREKIKTEMMYPISLLCLMILVVLFILLFVIPAFVNLFETMRMELPLPTRILLFVSAFLRESGWWVFIAMWTCGFGVVRLYRLSHCRHFVDRAILRLPVAGKLVEKINVARFCRNLGTLLHHGISIITAVDIARNMVDNRFLFHVIGVLKNDVRQGMPMAESLAMSGAFESMVVQLIEVGQETGQMDVMLDKIADFYEEDVDEMITRLSALLQPVMMVVLSLVIGGVVISVALPMFDSVTQAIG